MDANDPTSETKLVERVSTAFSSLSALFSLSECGIAVVTPLRSDSLDQLAQDFDDAIASIALDLKESGFGAYFIKNLFILSFSQSFSFTIYLHSFIHLLRQRNIFALMLNLNMFSHM